MSEKHRALPSWMSKKDKEKEKVKGPLKSKRKPKVARSVFYCMNEKELVEAALSYLSSSSSRAHAGLQREHKTEPKTTAQSDEERGTSGSEQTAVKPAASEASVESSGSEDPQDRTYVSESDMDITELETLPYPLCTEGNKQREVQNFKEEDANKDGVSQAAAEDDEKEDDAFQLVREIFFT